MRMVDILKQLLISWLGTLPTLLLVAWLLPLVSFAVIWIGYSIPQLLGVVDRQVLPGNRSRLRRAAHQGKA